MVLGGWLPGSPTLRRLSLWHPAFGVVPGALVLPHFNAFPAWLMNPLYALRPRGAFLLGIEGDTALIGRGKAWVVRGQGRVEVRREGAVSRFTEGQAVPL